MGICLSSVFKSGSTNNYSSAASERQCSSLSNDVGQVLPTVELTEFNFKMLKTATKNFNHHNIVGEGSFGKVFRGWLRLGRDCDANKTAVAIKRLHLSDVQHREALQTEIQLLGRLRHPNMVKLLGYCRKDSHIYIVYEYVMRGSLECHLFGTGSNVQPLSWERRIKIAVQAARAFLFLTESDDRVLCRDIKPSNILLDEAYNAKIDFCLEKLSPGCITSDVNVQHWNHLYVDPEIIRTGRITPKSDVYSFGVVLMELLTGLRANGKNISPQTTNVVEWEKPIWSNQRNLISIMDSKLGNYPISAAMELAKLASKCLAQSPQSRPSMEEVLEKLEQIQNIV